MVAENSLREGNPADALAQLQEQIRSDPSNAKPRIFLFQLLAILGQWDRALAQLKVAGELDPGALAMVQAYREALYCEAFRSKVFTAHHSPLIFGEPEQWIALMIESLRFTAQEQYAKAKELRDQAFADAPETQGTIDGQPFTWIADADTRLGPLLEILINGRYYWIPFHRIREIVIEEPEDLRDMVWMPAHCTWANGGDAVAMIPTRYPGSEKSEDGQIQMARRTEWEACEGDTYLGLGQRLLTTDKGEFPLMDIRRITFQTQAEQGELPDG